MEIGNIEHANNDKELVLTPSKTSLFPWHCLITSDLSNQRYHMELKWWSYRSTVTLKMNLPFRNMKSTGNRISFSFFQRSSGVVRLHIWLLNPYLYVCWRLETGCCIQSFTQSDLCSRLPPLEQLDDSCNWPWQGQPVKKRFICNSWYLPRTTIQDELLL